MGPDSGNQASGPSQALLFYFDLNFNSTCYVLLNASIQVSVVRQSEHKKWKLRAELMCRGCMLPGVDDSCEVARMNLAGQ